MDALRGTLASRWWRAVIAALLTALIAVSYVIGRDAPLINAIEGTALTWRFLLRGPVAPPGNVAILAIDDKTVTQLKRWPLPRRTIASSIARLTAHGATAIGVDLMFLEREQSSNALSLSGGDLALRDAMKAMPDTVISLAFTFGPSSTISADTLPALRDSSYRIVHQSGANPARGILRAADALMPIDAFRDVAGLGHVNVPVDHDGALRHLYPAIAIDSAFVPALPVEVARRFMRLQPDEVALLVGRGVGFGERLIATDPAMRLPINYYGPAGTIETFSMLDLLEDRVPAGRLAGRAVLIGATAVGVGDTFASPYSRALPGVEVLATAVANLVNGQTIDHSTRAMVWDIAAIVALGMLAYAIAHLPLPTLAFAGCALIPIAWFIVAQFAFSGTGLWLSIVFPTLAIVTNAGVVAGSRFTGERRMRHDVERQRSNLARYHSPIVADMLAQEGLRDMPEREQYAAILFVDLAGFTRRSEHMTPAETAQFLRNFHYRVERAVLAEGGVLEQFTGDGAMVIFGLPSPNANDAAAALACARALVADITAWSRDLAAAGDEPMRVGVGVHYGPVVIARVGGHKQIHLTATGDTVNVASRLEALTRTFNANIIVSEALVRAVRAVRREDLLADFAALAPQAIRGRDEKIGIWVMRANHVFSMVTQKE